MDDAWFRSLKQDDEGALQALWELVKRFGRHWWAVVGDDLQEIWSEAYLKLSQRVQAGEIEWQGQAQFSALVRQTVENLVIDWIRNRRIAPASEERPEAAAEAEVPAAGWGRRPLDPLTILLRRALDPKVVLPACELLVAIETAPSPQERLVLRADFWLWLHEELKPHQRTKEAAALAGLPTAKTFNPRAEGKRKVWEALRSEQAKNIFNAVWGPIEKESSKKSVGPGRS